MLVPEEFIEDAIQKIKEKIGDDKVIIALSDSSMDIMTMPTFFAPS